LLNLPALLVVKMTNGYTTTVKNHHVIDEDDDDISHDDNSDDDDEHRKKENNSLRSPARNYRDQQRVHEFDSSSRHQHDVKFKSKMSQGLQRFLAQWRVLLLGQFLAILLACSSALSASMHFECNISSPTFQTVLVFGLMSFHAFALIRRNKFTIEEKAGLDGNADHAGKRTMDPAVSESQDVGAKDFDESQITTPAFSMCCGLLEMNAQWWSYAVFAFVSVEASYLTFLAYRYTTLPSAALLDNTNILAAMIGSRIILKRRYSLTHILGALICCVGIFANIASDLEKSGEDASDIDDFSEQLEAVEYPKRMLGDILAILGGVFVGLSDVLIEMFVKDFVSVHEYLGCVGIFGTAIATVQALVLERKQIAKIFAVGSGEHLTTKEIYERYPDDPFNAPRSCPQETAIALVFGYALSTYIFNYCMSKFLSVSESALLTLSLLTSDLYSVLFTVFAQHIPPTGLFYVAFLLVIVGVVVYEMAPSPLEDGEDEHDGMMDTGNEMNTPGKRDIEMSRISLSWGATRDHVPQSNEKVDRREIL
jgi:Permeases of the drug/metabolite transporter (DMT) superfamily